MYCKNCGMQVSEDARFCTGCGTPVESGGAVREPDTDGGEMPEAYNALRWGSNQHDVQGLTPVRKRHIPPTDRVTTEAATIDIHQSPQISDYVIKSGVSKNLYKAPIAFSIFAFVLAAGAVAVAEPVLGAASAIAGAVLVILSVVLRQRSRGPFRLGFDWGTNTIWAITGGKSKPTYLGNANCITGLAIEKTRVSTSRIANVGNTDTRMYTSVRRDLDMWQLTVAKTDGSNIPLCSFYSEDEAMRVLNKASALLNQEL